MADALRIQGFGRFVKRDAIKRVSGDSGMPWVSTPTSMASRGRATILERHGNREGRIILSIWADVVSLAARCRGLKGYLIAPTRRPLSIAGIADRIEADETDVEAAVKAFIAVGWMAREEVPGASELDRDGSIPSERIIPPDDCPDNCPDKEPDDCPGRQKTEDRRQKTEELPSAFADSPASEPAGGDGGNSPDPPPDPGPKPEDLAAEMAVEAWNRSRRPCWPEARSIRKRGNLRARLGDAGSLDAFRAELDDRLRRMAHAYAEPVNGRWVPSLAWLLEPNGWEKAGDKPDPTTLPARASPGSDSPIDRLFRRTHGDDANGIGSSNRIGFAPAARLIPESPPDA